MRTFLPFTLLLFLLQISSSTVSWSQAGLPTHLFRASWDDDYLNFYGKGTDRAYTDGTRFELIEAKQKRPAFLLDRLPPDAGDSSTNLYGWGLTQLMFTPNNISNASFQPDDYPWSGPYSLLIPAILTTKRKRRTYRRNWYWGLWDPGRWQDPRKPPSIV